MVSATILASKTGFLKLFSFVKMHPFLGISTIILTIIIFQAVYSSFVLNDPSPFKEQVGDRIFNSDTKTYNELKTLESNNYVIPYDGYFTKQRFILGLLVTLWFEISIIVFIASLLENSFEAKVPAYMYALLIVFIFMLFVNIWNYNFHDDNKLVELSGWQKAKYTFVQLVPIKGLYTLITDSPSIYASTVSIPT